MDARTPRDRDPQVPLDAENTGALPRRLGTGFLLDGIIRDFNLPEPHRQFAISLPDKEIRVDYSYPEGRLIIEADSYAFHGDRPTFDADRERDAELQALGWRVLRFTWAQLKWRREWVAEMIARHLDAEW